MSNWRKYSCVPRWRICLSPCRQDRFTILKQGLLKIAPRTFSCFLTSTELKIANLTNAPLFDNSTCLFELYYFKSQNKLEIAESIENLVKKLAFSIKYELDAQWMLNNYEKYMKNFWPRSCFDWKLSNHYKTINYGNTYRYLLNIEIAMNKVIDAIAKSLQIIFLSNKFK